ncbi:hypothetical protein V1281_006655 [Nitrobacteraceae bacterium AZCC 2161]
MRSFVFLATTAFVFLDVSVAIAQISCDSLWLNRNAIYKDAGYCFKTPKAIETFGSAGCRFDDIKDLPLSDRDRQVIDEIARTERLVGCGGAGAPSSAKRAATRGFSYQEITMRIDLTPAARKKLVENGETISWSARYYGNSKRSEGANPFGDVFLGETNGDVGPEIVLALVPGGMFDARGVDRIYDRDPQVNINIFSSRRVFKYNVLSCDTPQDSVAELAKQVQPVKCGLIGER